MRDSFLSETLAIRSPCDKITPRTQTNVHNTKTNGGGIMQKQAYRVPGARPAIRAKELPAYIAQNAGFIWARD